MCDNCWAHAQLIVTEGLVDVSDHGKLCPVCREKLTQADSALACWRNYWFAIKEKRKQLRTYVEEFYILPPMHWYFRELIWFI